MRASLFTNPIVLLTNSRVRRYWNPLSLTQLIRRNLWGKFAQEILAVDRVDARHLVRPSTGPVALFPLIGRPSLAHSGYRNTLYFVWTHPETRVCLSATSDLGRPSGGVVWL